jgi:hypothetical protein
METFKGVLLAPVLILYSLAGPITYILSVLDTWDSRMSVFWKLFFNLTLDGIEAGLWPFTWTLG